MILPSGTEQVVPAASLELVQPDRGDRVLMLSNDSNHVGETGVVLGQSRTPFDVLLTGMHFPVADYDAGDAYVMLPSSREIVINRFSTLGKLK